LRFGAMLLMTTLFFGVAGCHQRLKREAEVKIMFTQVPQQSAGDQNQLDVMENRVAGSDQRTVRHAPYRGDYSN